MIYDEKYLGFYKVIDELYDIPAVTMKYFFVKFCKMDLDNIPAIIRKFEQLLKKENMTMNIEERRLLSKSILKSPEITIGSLGCFYLISNKKIAQIGISREFRTDNFHITTELESLCNSKTWRELQEKEENLKINFDETREDFPIYAKELFENPNDLLQHFEIKYSQKDLGNMASISKRTESQLNYEGMAMEKSDLEKLGSALAQSLTIEEGATRNSLYLISNSKLAKIDICNKGNGCYAICVAFDYLFNSDTWYRNHVRWS